MPLTLLELYAKSARGKEQPERLTAHSRATLSAVRDVETRIGQLGVVKNTLATDFWPVAVFAGLLHDAGKVADGFREMVLGESGAWGERHEVLSLGFVDALVAPPLSAWVAVPVATHHRAIFSGDVVGGGGSSRKRPLQDLYRRLSAEDLAARFTPVRDEPVAAFAQWLYETAADEQLPLADGPPALDGAALLDRTHRAFESLKTAWEDVDDDDGLTAVLLQGAVTMADHLASAGAHLRPDQPLGRSTRHHIDKDLADKGGRLLLHQSEAAEVNGHLVVRAPTGSGKTESVLLWAARQAEEIAAEHSAVPRVFYALPYLASINSMAERLGKLIRAPEAVGVAHSRAASFHLDRATSPEDRTDADAKVSAAEKAVSRAAATSLFHETLRVGTPYRLMRGSLLGPSHSSTLLDTANSVFVFDEIHAYDPRRLGYLLACMRVWERLGSRLAVVSATLPETLQELFRETLAMPINLVEPSGPPAPARHRIGTRPHQLTDDEARSEISARLSAGDSVLVVANNVAHAVDLYTTLGPRAEEVGGTAHLLHSRFTRRDRIEIEKEITNRFASKRTRRHRGLVVATQAIEVSLDLDFDVLFTASAPLEALLQRFGRTNRLGRRPPADVVVHAPSEVPEGTRRDAVDGIYPRAPVSEAWARLSRHDGRTLGEAEASEWLEEIYHTDWGKTWRREVEEHRDDFAESFFDFSRPFESRENVAETFDRLFDGTEAVLAQDRADYEQALQQGSTAAGRLLADEYLLPLPHWSGPLSDWDAKLKVRIVEGDYDPEFGLLSVHGRSENTYEPGEVL